MSDAIDAVVTRNSGPIIFLKRFISHTNYRLQRDKQRTGQTNGSETRERSFFGKDPFKFLSDEEILKDKFTHETCKCSTSVKSQQRLIVTIHIPRPQ